MRILEAGEAGTYKATFADGTTAAAAGKGKLTITPAEVTRFNGTIQEPFTYDGTAKTVNAAVSNLGSGRHDGGNLVHLCLSDRRAQVQFRNGCRQLYGNRYGSWKSRQLCLEGERGTERGLLLLEIKTNKVDKPAADATQFIYNGSTQTYSVAENPPYTVTSNEERCGQPDSYGSALPTKYNTVWADTGDAKGM